MLDPYCELFEEKLDDYLADAVTTELKKQLTDHAAVCPYCYQILRQAKTLNHHMAALSVDPPEELFTRVMGEVRRRNRARSRKQVGFKLLPMVACLMVVVSAILVFPGIHSQKESLNAGEFDQQLSAGGMNDDVLADPDGAPEYQPPMEDNDNALEDMENTPIVGNPSRDPVVQESAEIGDSTGIAEDTETRAEVDCSSGESSSSASTTTSETKETEAEVVLPDDESSLSPSITTSAAEDGIRDEPLPTPVESAHVPSQSVTDLLYNNDFESVLDYSATQIKGKKLKYGIAAVLALTGVGLLLLSLYHAVRYRKQQRK